MADDVKQLPALATPSGWELPQLTEEQINEIAEAFRPHKAGVAKFSPRRCPGPSCHEAQDCPLVRQEIPLPVGRACFVELNLINTMVGAMAQELQLDKDEVFAVNSIGAIAINNVVIKRAMEILNREEIIVDSFRAMTPEGDPVFERKAHPSVGVIKEFQKLTQLIQQDLMATRKERSKDAARKRISPTEIAQKLKEKMQQARIGVDQGMARLKEHYNEQNQEPEVIEADFQVVEEKTDGDRQDVQRNGGQRRPEEAGQESQEGKEGSQEPEEAHDSEEERELLKRDPRTGFLRRE